MGYIDVVVAKGDELVVIDFKTDAAPLGPVAQTHAEHVEQVGTYARMLGAAKVRGGLLFTQDGGVRWVLSPTHRPPPGPEETPGEPHA